MNIIDLILEKLHHFQGIKRTPKQKKEIDYTEPRKNVGKIYIAVLTERISVREGLLMFPREAMKDRSIQAAWHALCHYEADEDIKRRDLQYANEQQELMELIAFSFRDGKELPINIIDSYEEFYDEALIAPLKGTRAIWDRLLRFINTY